jgi:hypothetical protein
MKEKQILKDTVRDGKPLEKKTKRYYKPRKKNEEGTMTHEVANSEKPYVANNDGLKIPNTVGRYCMGTGKGFCIHLEKKPNWLHRKCMKLFLGWDWKNSK